jgi:hypothetical protein
MLLQQYMNFVEQTVFPNGVQSLRLCKNVEEVTLWKKMITREVYSKQVQGEALEDLLPIDNPQEENKVEFTMPQKVFIEAKKLQDEQRLAD